MPILYLKLKATLAGVTDLAPIDTQAEPYEYVFKVTCTTCRTTHDKAVLVNRFETYDTNDSKGHTNFSFRCKECKKAHNANFERTTDVYTEEKNGKWVPMLQIDARGIEFSDFEAEGRFEAKGISSGTKFDEIDLSDKEWYDYDDRAGNEVSVTEVEWEIERL